MPHPIKLLAAGGMLALAVPAHAAGWQLQPADAGRGAVLTYNSGQPVSYRFECAPDAVVITETGVTKLLDLKTGKAIGDGVDAAMPEGAAMMALFAGKGDPQFTPAVAVKNPAGGWDLTIRLSKEDKLKAIGKSQMMSLFTTGYTMAVSMDASARASWEGFLQACKTPR